MTPPTKFQMDSALLCSLTPKRYVKHSNKLAVVTRATRTTLNILFSSILDSLTGNDPTVTEYVLEIPAKCPHCGTAVTEWTLVEWDGVADQAWSLE